MDSRLQSALRSLVQSIADSLADSLSAGPRSKIEAVCQAFYDRQLLSQVEDDARDEFFAALADSIGQADRAFGRYVDQDDFRLEVIALRLELFGLALTHRVGWRRDDLCLRELTSTRRYLQERDELRVWDSMGAYNQSIAEAGLTLNRSRRELGRRLSLHLAASEGPRAKDTPSDCFVRYANRYDSEATWRNGIATTHLIRALADRLDFRPNAQGQIRLQTLLYVFYDEALQRLRRLRLV